MAIFTIFMILTIFMIFMILMGPTIWNGWIAQAQGDVGEWEVRLDRFGDR
jgi:hypothetical protein